MNYFLMVVVALAIIAFSILGAYVWMFRTLDWINRRTIRDAFFNLPLAERRALRLQIQKKARWLRLLITPLTKLGIRIPVVEFEGTKVPGNCPKDAMAYARDYQPEDADIFVATQMKCGTTWMQQIVYQIITKGEGGFSDDGHRHMNALSPWIESVGSVSLPDAPLVEGRRIVKTHLGTELCPYSDKAKYIYVVRHPVACLASAKDFVSKLMGPMAPQKNDFEGWFCSDDMWWGTWASHAEGWWQWSQDKDNVLFVHYEQLLEHPESEIQRIAEFLDVELNEQQLANAVEKSSYRYMKENDHYFEMSAPTPMDVGGLSFFVKGSSDRANDVSEEVRQRVNRFCAEELKGARYPVTQFYPDVM